MIISALFITENQMFKTRKVVKSMVILLMMEYYAVIKNTVKVLFKNHALNHLSGVILLSFSLWNKLRCLFPSASDLSPTSTQISR